jgi:hypothetical protein
MHVSMLTPMPDALGERLPDEPKPFLPLVLVSFLVIFVLHQTYPAPSAGEDTRGYLHGGLVIDFIGQQGPTSRWRLAALDVCILLLQLLMVAVHQRRLTTRHAPLRVRIPRRTPTTKNAACSTGPTRCQKLVPTPTPTTKTCCCPRSTPRTPGTLTPWTCSPRASV